MEFQPIGNELEEVLHPIYDAAGGDTMVFIDAGFVNPELEELDRLGFFKCFNVDLTMNVNVALSYQGIKYFKKKEEWRAAIAKLAAAESGITDQDIDRLAILAEKYLDTDMRPVSTDDFNVDDQAEMDAIRKLGKHGYVSVYYADDNPYLVSVTESGFRLLAVQEQDAKADGNKPKGRVSQWLARMTGTYTGAVIKEINDL